MKKKYVNRLIAIAILFSFALVIGTGYGLHLSTSTTDKKNATTSDCFKLYYSDDENEENIELRNIIPLTNEEAASSTSPYTLTITNICSDAKTVEVRLNTLKETTFDTNALTVNATGNIELNEILYKNLPTTKTKDKKVSKSKLLGKLNIKPNETIRTNIKLWFDDRKVINIKKEDIFKAKFEIIDTKNTEKVTFHELVKESAKINNNEIKYDKPSIKTDGLIKVNANNEDYYYYRGIVNNNYVKFGNYIWRIVAINPDNSIKLILDKSISQSQYSDKQDAPDYTGFTYIYIDFKRNVINNNIINTLDNWYTLNIVNRDLDKYVLSKDFCNDTSYPGQQIGPFNTYNRLVTNKKPSLACEQSNADFGGVYNRKIGLITADEVAIAGAVYDIPNYNFYLNNGETFFTMSPAEYESRISYIFGVSNDGKLEKLPTTNSEGIRPVINIDGNLHATGSGTIDNPYVINTENN